MQDDLTEPPPLLGAALEKTVPAAEFRADCTRREIEQTVIDSNEAHNQRCGLGSTLSEEPPAATDSITRITRFGTASPIPLELLREDQQPGPRYVLGKAIGDGGTATIYGVEDCGLGRMIALKLLNHPRNDETGVKQRFLHEARVTAMLEHPNIVPIYDIGVTHSREPYILMKNIAGMTVGDGIRAQISGLQKMPEFATVDFKLQIIHKVCDALSFAHDRGVIHQDIKPDNIMIGGYGEVLVLDWGCALERQGVAGMGTVGFGTPAYMSPEQARQEWADERSDIYCLGATLYHMLTLQHPTRAPTPEQFWEMKRAGQLSSLKPEIERRIPAPLLAVAHRAMAACPSQRYQNIAELRAAIHEYELHVESVAMTREAIAMLPNVSKSQDYQQFFEVTTSLKQALRMWPGNAQAQNGLYEACREHAMCALEKGDLELADSLVAEQTDCDDLRARITHERESRKSRAHATRRAQLAVAGLAAMIIAFSSYAIIDYLRQFGNWQLVYQQDFTRPDAPTADLAMSRTRLEQDDAIPVLTTDGLRLDGARTLWFNETRETGAMRVEVVLRWPQRVDGFEIHINARRAAQETFWHCPAGYSSQFGGWAGTLNILSRSETPRPPNNGNAVGADFEPGRIYRLWFERVGDELALYVNKRKLFSISEPIPIAGEGLDRVALRSWVDVDILSCSMWRLGSARKPTPLLAGDVLVRRGHHDEAIREYLRIARDHYGSPITKDALLRAYLLTSAGWDDDSLREEIRHTMKEQPNVANHWSRMLEADCERSWGEGQFDEALQIASDLLQTDKRSRIALKLLAAWRETFALGVGDRLLQLVGRTQQVSGLRLVEMGLTTLEPLRGMRLKSLDCSRNRIATLDPLKSMPLRMLQAVANTIESLEPLHGMPLELLDVSDNRISDLSPLANAPLQQLVISNNDISDLDPLIGMPLKVLACNHNRIGSLEPLQNSPLIELNCESNPIHSLAPLQGMSLAVLQCSECQISSLEPLKGMPLRRLRARDNQISLLAPLQGMSLLTDLDCQQNDIIDLSPLSGMSLQTLRLARNQIQSLAPLRAMPLHHLDVGDCQVSDLEPLRGMKLQMLNLYQNKVTDLRPLAKMPLRLLDVHGNPLHDLIPFVSAPPEFFYFDTVALDEHSLQGILARWESAGREATVRTVRALRANNRQDYLTLRDFAVAFGKQRYLFLPVPLTWDQANDVAQKAGAHLAAITDKAERDFTLSLLPDGTAGWIGLKRGDDGTGWSTNEPFVWTDFNSRWAARQRSPVSQLRHALGSGHWYASYSPDEKNGALLEWEP